MDELPPKLLSTLSQAADLVRGHRFIQVFSHFDADGVSSAAILAKALMREGKEFRVTLFTTLNDYNMNVIRSTKADCIIVSDLGASYIDQLDELETPVVVLDHHTIISEAKRVVYANPHLYGIDGMTSGCGATMCLLFAVTLSESNWDLVQIAFAGIAGDRQHINGLSGLNVHLLEEGTRRGFVTKIPGSLIPSGNLMTRLYLDTDPYIRGVSGSVEGVAKLLEDAGIPNDKSFSDLTDEERRTLSSLIAVRMAEQGVQLSSMNEIARDRYMLKDWSMDAEHLASLLNSCGRSGIGGAGIAAGMGDERCLKMAEEVDDESAKELVKAMRDLDERGLTQAEHFQWFDSTDSGFTGMLCGISMQSTADPDKPTIGMNRSGDPVNISSRGMWGQLDRGIDLAAAMREACASVGGSGGGHKIAAGGSVPADSVDQFLKNLDGILAAQLEAGKKA
ncbi:MAG: DHH family phosphoesterase [Thermoplasmata archaeon]|nr:DHH family phosphoesterase [Thermoplasmata archaeon]